MMGSIVSQNRETHKAPRCQEWELGLALLRRRATVRGMEQPSWPHPLRNTETDPAQAVAEALAWYGMWLWE